MSLEHWFSVNEVLQHYTRTGRNLQQCSSAANASITQLLKRMSSYSLSEDLLELIGHSQKAKLDSDANSTENHYSYCFNCN
jgi:hypothetical protein